MKTLLSFHIFTLFLFLNSFSQERPHDAYFNEEQTYFTNLIPTSYGLVLTDNYSSSIYLVKDGKLNVLTSSPGCGRYMRLSSDKCSILFKLINNNGQQSPARLNLVNGKVEQLGEFVDLCSQPVSDNQSNICYGTPGNFIIKNNDVLKSFKINGYVNYPALSGNGELFVYNDNNDQLFIKDLPNNKTELITDNKTGYVYPNFSPKDDFLVYNSLQGELYIYDVLNKKNRKVGMGGNVRWISDFEFVFTSYDENSISSMVYSKIISEDNLQLKTLNLPSGSMFAAPMGNDLYFTKQGTRELYKIKINNAINNTGRPQLIYNNENKLPINYYSINNSSKAIVKVPGTVPYVHQVYDTPSWHSGYGSCAPTTSVMAFAYYNRLPPWPVSVDHGQSWDPHVNNYGSYVADRYRFNEIYYSETADAYGTTAYGGYGYMWTGSYSPNSRMKAYIENHYMTSNQLWTTSCTFNNTIVEIDGGYVHPICNYLTTSGHLILTTGYIVGQHTLIFNDPYGNKNTPGYPSYDGYDSYYDWPGYSNGNQNLDASGTHGGVAWTVKSQTSQPLYNDTIIDNVDYNHGFYMSNVTNGSHMRYFHDYNVGYNGHTWWTYTMLGISDICYTTWGPNLNQTGNYKVEVYIPSNGATCTNARYHINYNGGDSLVILNQSIYSDQWVELGIFPFHSGQGNYVYLGDSTGIDNQMIAFDAMRWSFVPSVSANFTSTNHTICTGNSIYFTNACQNADSCRWILPGSNLNITNLQNPVAVYNSAGTFDVTLIAYSNYGNDTMTIPGYVIVNASPVADFICNSTTVQLPNAIVLFTNNSQNANSFFWNFGDGTNSTDQNPYHIYTASGIYNITLIAFNSLCASDTTIMYNYINVLNASGINVTSSNKPNVFTHNGFLNIYSGNLELKNVQINICDELGRTVLSKHENRINEFYSIPVQHLSGIYIVTLSSDQNETIAFKFVNIK